MTYGITVIDDRSVIDEILVVDGILVIDDIIVINYRTSLQPNTHVPVICSM